MQKDVKELTKCPHCGRVLVGHEEIHAVKGTLYCSKGCAVNHIMEDYILNAKELAIEAYDSEAEIVSTEDVLRGELQKVKIIVTCTKVVNVPSTMTEAEAVCEACTLYNQGLVVVDLDDCDESSITYELVKDENSECVEG